MTCGSVGWATRPGISPEERDPGALLDAIKLG